jgi:hypothetical protein
MAAMGLFLEEEKPMFQKVAHMVVMVVMAEILLLLVTII